METEKRKTPFRCYRIADVDGVPRSFSAKCVEIKRSWWTIELAGGTRTKENGGGPYSERLPTAWDRAVTLAFWKAESERRRNGSAKAVDAAEARVGVVLAAMWNDAIRIGKTIGERDGS